MKETIRHPGAVTIVPFIDDEHVCLIRNDRMAVGQTLIELPAGTLEEGEDPIDAAHRELTEETGYRAEVIEHLDSFWMSPGILNERMHLFLARGLTAGSTKLEADERIETFIVRWREALDMVDRGIIQDAKTIIGLLYYDRRNH